jgi:transposase
MTRLEDSSTVTYTKNSDGSSSCTIQINPIGTKCMEVIAAKPEEFIENYFNVRIKNQGEQIIKSKMDSLIEQNKLEEMKSMEATILEYEISSREPPTL